MSMQPQGDKLTLKTPSLGSPKKSKMSSKQKTPRASDTSRFEGHKNLVLKKALRKGVHVPGTQNSDDLACVADGNDEQTKFRAKAVASIQARRERPPVKAAHQMYHSNGRIPGYDEQKLQKYMSGELAEADFVPPPVQDATMSPAGPREGGFADVMRQRQQKLMHTAPTTEEERGSQAATTVVSQAGLREPTSPTGATHSSCKLMGPIEVSAVEHRRRGDGTIVPQLFNSVQADNMTNFVRSHFHEDTSASLGFTTTRPAGMRDSAAETTTGKNLQSTRTSGSQRNAGATSSVDGSLKARGGGLMGLKLASSSGHAHIAKLFGSRMQSPGSIDQSLLSSTFGAAAPGDNMETASRQAAVRSSAPQVRFSDRKRELIRGSIEQYMQSRYGALDTLGDGSSVVDSIVGVNNTSVTARGGPRLKNALNTAREGAKFLMDSTDKKLLNESRWLAQLFDKKASTLLSPQPQQVDWLKRGKEAEQPKNRVFYNPLRKDTDTPENLSMSGPIRNSKNLPKLNLKPIEEIKNRKAGGMSKPQQLLKQYKAGELDGQLQKFYMQDKVRYVSEEQVFQGLEHFQMLIEESQMREIDAHIARVRLQAQHAKMTKEEIWKQKYEKHMQRDQELMPAYIPANLVPGLDQPENIKGIENAREELELRDQLRKLDMKECELIASLYRKHFEPAKCSPTIRKSPNTVRTSPENTTTSEENSRQGPDTTLGTRPDTFQREENEMREQQLSAEKIKAMQEIKYVQYLPSAMGQPFMDLDRSIKALYKTRPTNINQNPRLRTVDPEQTRKGYIYQNHKKDCMAKHRHSVYCSHAKDLDLAKLQSLAFEFMCLQKPSLQMPVPGVVSNENRASFFPDSKIPHELDEAGQQAGLAAKLNAMSEGKLSRLFLKKISNFLKDLDPRDYNMILPGEFQQFQHALGPLSDIKDNYESGIKGVERPKRNNKTEEALRNLLQSIEQRERSLNLLKVKQLSKTGGIRELCQTYGLQALQPVSRDAQRKMKSGAVSFDFAQKADEMLQESFNSASQELITQEDDKERSEVIPEPPVSDPATLQVPQQIQSALPDLQQRQQNCFSPITSDQTSAYDGQQFGMLTSQLFNMQKSPMSHFEDATSVGKRLTTAITGSVNGRRLGTRNQMFRKSIQVANYSKNQVELNTIQETSGPGKTSSNIKGNSTNTLPTEGGSAKHVSLDITQKTVNMTGLNSGSQDVPIKREIAGQTEELLVQESQRQMFGLMYADEAILEKMKEASQMTSVGGDWTGPGKTSPRADVCAASSDPASPGPGSAAISDGAVKPLHLSNATLSIKGTAEPDRLAPKMNQKSLNNLNAKEKQLQQKFNERVIAEQIYLQAQFESLMRESLAIKQEVAHRMIHGDRDQAAWQTPFQKIQKAKETKREAVRQKELTTLGKQKVVKIPQGSFDTWTIAELGAREYQLQQKALELQVHRAKLVKELQDLQSRFLKQPSIDSAESLLEISYSPVVAGQGQASPLRSHIYPKDAPLLHLQDADAQRFSGNYVSRTSSQRPQGYGPLDSEPALNELERARDLQELFDEPVGSGPEPLSGASKHVPLNDTVHGSSSFPNTEANQSCELPGRNKDAYTGSAATTQDQEVGKKRQRRTVDLQRTSQHLSPHKVDLIKKAVGTRQGSISKNVHQGPRNFRLALPGVQNVDTDGLTEAGKKLMKHANSGSGTALLGKNDDEAVLGTIYGSGDKRGQEDAAELEIDGYESQELMKPSDDQLDIGATTETKQLKADGGRSSRRTKGSGRRSKRDPSSRQRTGGGVGTRQHSVNQDNLGGDMLASSFEDERDLLSSNKKKRRVPNIIGLNKLAIRSTWRREQLQKKQMCAVPVIAMGSSSNSVDQDTNSASLGLGLGISLLPQPLGMKQKSPTNRSPTIPQSVKRYVEVSPRKLFSQPQQESVLKHIDAPPRTAENLMTPQTQERASDNLRNERRSSDMIVTDPKPRVFSNQVGERPRHQSTHQIEEHVVLSDQEFANETKYTTGAAREIDMLESGENQEKPRLGRKLNIVIHTTAKEDDTSFRKTLKLSKDHSLLAPKSGVPTPPGRRVAYRMPTQPEVEVNASQGLAHPSLRGADENTVSQMLNPTQEETPPAGVPHTLMHRTNGTGGFNRVRKSKCHGPFRSSNGMRNDISIDLLDKTYTIKQAGDDDSKQMSVTKTKKLLQQKQYKIGQTIETERSIPGVLRKGNVLAKPNSKVKKEK